jgi:hypothetical protein
MEQIAEICILCAWRATCQKKFSISGRDVRCPDFSKDLTIKEAEGRETEEEGKEG